MQSVRFPSAPYDAAQIPFATADTPIISIVVPIYNEEESIPHLIEALSKLGNRLERSYEIIFVDDGSTDDSALLLVKAAEHDQSMKVVEFGRNAGQTAALMAGIDYSSGAIIVTLDADLQNDPDDIPMLLDKLDEGFGVVSGWRKDRKDSAIRRNLMSRLANSVISRVSGVPLHDYGCTLKAYRKEMLVGMRLYGEMHRFVPIYASWMGAKVVEVPVRHHARRFGVSKYGLNRTFKVILDLCVVKFFSNYLTKPIYVFGGFGIWTLFSSIAVLGYAGYLKLFKDVSLIQTPLPVLAAILALIGCVSIMMGLLAEIMVRTYFESSGRTHYNVRRLTNLRPMS
jgi:dolichol-phosphate mannosyltransferase